MQVTCIRLFYFHAFIKCLGSSSIVCTHLEVKNFTQLEITIIYFLWMMSSSNQRAVHLKVSFKSCNSTLKNCYHFILQSAPALQLRRTPIKNKHYLKFKIPAYLLVIDQGTQHASMPDEQQRHLILMQLFSVISNIT